MTTPDRRRAELAKIHLAKKELNLDDAAYRAVLWTVARVRSAADLDRHGRSAVLDHFKARGFRARGRTVKARASAERAVRPPADRRALQAKIDAQLGDRPKAYGDALARRIAGVERLDWCRADQLHKIVAALWYDARRRGA